MTTLGVDLEGVPTVEASVAALVAALQDPATAEAATHLVAASSRPLVPVGATGRLAASEQVARTSTGAALVYGARYAVFVQASQPWLGEGITRAVPDLVALYERQAVEAWGT